MFSLPRVFGDRIVFEASLPALMQKWLEFEVRSEIEHGFPDDVVPGEDALLVRKFRDWRQKNEGRIPIEIPWIDLSLSPMGNLEFCFRDGRHRTAALHYDDHLPTIPVLIRPEDLQLWQCYLAPQQHFFELPDHQGVIRPLTPSKDLRVEMPPMPIPIDAPILPASQYNY
jgi:hypothetical protein